MVKKKKREKSKKEEVCEIINIKKEGKEETKEFCGTKEDKPASKGQIKKYNKQLKIILGILGAIILAFVVFFLLNRAVANFTYEGVNFKIIKEGELIFYNTVLPVYSEEGKYMADYNFYIRKDPRKLEDVPFIGDHVMTKNMVINITEGFNCEGDGIIALANFVNLYEFIGMKVIQDPNAGCELTGQYTFVRIVTGNETKIEKYGPSCYEISINECEILEGTERFMVETFIKTNEFLNK